MAKATDLIKVFSKLYVGLKKQGKTGEEENPNLGFLTPYEENAAGRKRIETVDSWSRPRDEYQWDENLCKQILVKKGQQIPAQILDNVPLEGFEICREVKRTGWNGGNVVWRILDPRGFELEISSSNMAKILTFATLEAGVIKGKCIWGRLGAHNLLMPEGCPEYANILPKAEEFNLMKSLKGKLIPNSQIKIGDYITLHNQHKGHYCGKWNILHQAGYNDTLFDTVTVRHVILCDDAYYVISELKVLSVDDNPSKAMKVTEISALEQKLNKVKRFKSFGTASGMKPALVCSEKIDISKAKVENHAIDLDFLLKNARDPDIKNKFRHISVLFNFKDFKKDQSMFDYEFLTLQGRLKNGNYFRPFEIEVTSPAIGEYPRTSLPEVDVWMYPNQFYTRATRVDEKGCFTSLRGRRKNQFHYSVGGRNYFTNSIQNSVYPNAAISEALEKFFKEEVEEVTCFVVTYTKSDGTELSNVAYW